MCSDNLSGLSQVGHFVTFGDDNIVTKGGRCTLVLHGRCTLRQRAAWLVIRLRSAFLGTDASLSCFSKKFDGEMFNACHARF